MKKHSELFRKIYKLEIKSEKGVIRGFLCKTQPKTKLNVMWNEEIKRSRDIYDYSRYDFLSDFSDGKEFGKTINGNIISLSKNHFGMKIEAYMEITSNVTLEKEFDEEKEIGKICENKVKILDLFEKENPHKYKLKNIKKKKEKFDMKKKNEIKKVKKNLSIEKKNKRKHKFFGNHTCNSYCTNSFKEYLESYYYCGVRNKFYYDSVSGRRIESIEMFNDHDYNEYKEKFDEDYYDYYDCSEEYYNFLYKVGYFGPCAWN